MQKYLMERRQGGRSGSKKSAKDETLIGGSGKEDATEHDEGSEHGPGSERTLRDRSVELLDVNGLLGAPAPLIRNSTVGSSTLGSPESSERFKLLKTLESERRVIEPSFLSHSSRAATVSQTMSLQKLKWNQLGLYGREKEIEQLSTALNLVTSAKDPMAKGSRTLVLIDGPSGVGKTALAAQLQEPVQRANGMYMLGKFDLQQMGEPFSGVKIAMTQLCHSILSLKARTSTDGHSVLETVQHQQFATIQAKLIEEISPETVQLLANLVPSLWAVMGMQQQHQPKPKSFRNAINHPMEDESLDGGNHRDGRPSMRDTSSRASKKRKPRRSTTAMRGKEAVDQLTFAFKSFLQAVSSLMSLVIVLDDVQWADQPSLDLIKSWICDVENQSLMIVGCFRSNEDHEAVTELIQDIQFYENKRNIEILQIHLGDLDKTSVHTLIADVLNMESARIESLADIVYHKTNGNVFYLIQFMESLATLQLLSFNFGLGCWTWDDEQVKLRSDMTQNVVQLVKYKLQQQPQTVVQ